MKNKKLQATFQRHIDAQYHITQKIYIWKGVRQARKSSLLGSEKRILRLVCRAKH